MSARALLALCCLMAQGLVALSARPDARPPSTPASPAIQSGTVDQAVVDMALAAATDDARAALFEAHPEIITEPTRAAIATAAIKASDAGDATRAFNGHRTLLYAAARTNNRRARMVALNAIGTLAGQRGDFALAEPALVEARALADAIGDPTFLISASNNLGIVQRLQGKYDEAIANYRRTLTVAEAAGRRDSVARTLNNLGVVAQQQGDFRAALDYLTRSLALKEELGQTQDLATASLNIGVLHHQQRNFPLALDYYERSRVRAAAAGNRRGLVSALTAIGEIHTVERRYGAAKDALAQALPLADALGDALKTATVWHNLGVVARAERRWADAEAALTRSLEMREASGDRPGMTDSLIGLAELFRLQGHPERALGFAERSVEIARAIGFEPSLWSGLSILGRANVALGRPDAAVPALEESIEVIERMRRHVAGGEQELERFFEDKTTPYYELAAAQAALGRPANAFAAVERARARVLLDLIETGTPIVGALSDAERERERQLDRDLLALNARREAAARQNPAQGSPAQADRLRDLDDELERARRAKDEWQFHAYAAHPDLRFGRGAAPIVSLEQAADVVPPGTAIVVLLAGVDRTSVLLLTHQPGQRGPSIRLFTIRATREDLARRADAFSRQIGRRDLAFATSARGLYDTLLGPVDAQLPGVTHLVIVPDGALWNVPFQALMTPRGRFLIEERAVSYAPSVSALYRLQERRRSRGSHATRLVAMGDPTAPATASARLPQAAREVRTLARMYGPDARLFVGARATEAQFRESAPEATVLHIATHGELVSASPMYSFVTLGGSGESDDLGRDGRIEAWEIANLSLQADLVVLSACETARGGVGGGEGVMGLAWSLFAAGASTAAVSQWRVDSQSTTELMLAFHRSGLSRGPGWATPADAMRAAARTLIASPQYRHPYYWAGFVVIGVP